MSVSFPQSPSTTLHLPRPNSPNGQSPGGPVAACLKDLTCKDFILEYRSDIPIIYSGYQRCSRYALLFEVPPKVVKT